MAAGRIGGDRRSGARLPNTLATEASAVASDLPAALVACLQDPSVVVDVLVEPAPSTPTAVLYALDPERPDDDRLLVEIAAADTVVVEDEAAAGVLGRRGTSGPVAVEGRVLVVASSDLPGRSVADRLADVELDVLGLVPALAAAAASPSRRPLVVATAEDPREAIGRTPATSRLVVAVDSHDVAGLVELATEVRGTSGAVIVGPRGRPRRTGLNPVIEHGVVHLCFDANIESTALDPSVREAVQRLVADGVPTKTAATALATLTGWERRRAYDTVLSWRAP